jgi:hypothetical protein
MVKTLCINGWYGRLGNNIIQVRNALHIALYCGDYSGVVIPRHTYFNKCRINIGDNICEEKNEEMQYGYDCNQFYNDDMVSYVKPECFSMNNETVRSIIMDLFVIDYTKLTPLDENELVMHIRSGDAIKYIHPQYVIPPLSYYTNVIESGKYNKIYIIAEDKLNPCIDVLCSKYSNIVFKLSDLTKDIELVLRARNIMMTIGTFIPSLLWLTKYTSEVIYPCYDEFTRHMIPLNNMNMNMKLTKVVLAEYYKNVIKNESSEDRIKRMMIS